MGYMNEIELALREYGFNVCNTGQETKRAITFCDLSGRRKRITTDDFFNLTILLGDYEKATLALKSGLNLKDFISGKYAGLPAIWVYNMLVDEERVLRTIGEHNA